MKSTPQKAQVIYPTRTANEDVILVKCQPGYGCLDVENFKKLLRNANNTETYIQQLMNLLEQLAEPIESK